MAAKLTQTEDIKKFLNIASGMTSEKGNPRTKKIVHRIVTDLFSAIDQVAVQVAEALGLAPPPFPENIANPAMASPRSMT